MQTTYQPGDAVKITFTITDSNGVLFDPTTVLFHFTNPTGTTATKTVGVDADSIKISTGVYQLLIYVPYAAASVGTWTYDAQGKNISAQSIVVEKGDFAVQYLKTLP